MRGGGFRPRRELREHAEAFILRLKYRRMEIDAERRIAQIVRETGADHPQVAVVKSKLPGDSRAVRGIPAFMSGERGAIRGSSPDIDGLRRAEQREII